MRHLAKVISFLFHPVFLYFYLVVLAYYIDAYSYKIEGAKAIGLLFIMTFFTLVLFPIITVALLKGLHFIPSFTMPKREHRIGALIGTSVFYIWYYINIKNNVAFPLTLEFISLGSAIAVGTAFFINNFSKISLHAIGAGSFIMALVLLIFYTKSSYLTLSFSSATYEISTVLILILAILVFGSVGTSRLLLKVHRTDDIFGGYIVGILAQLIAFNIIM